MTKKVTVINGVRYLADVSNDDIFEISDYTEISDGLFIIGIIIDRDQYHYCGKTYNNYKKKWGCINYLGDVIIPFDYVSIKQKFDFIEACFEEASVCFNHYRYFYFDNQGIPICPNTKVRFYGWTRVEYFDGHNISIGQKNGKQGILRKDGTIFIEPLYLSIKIDYTVKVITAVCDNRDIIQWIYRKETQRWIQLPNGHRYVGFFDGLYVLEVNEQQYAKDILWKTVIPPYFSCISVYKDYCIVCKNGTKGLLSRKKMMKIKGLNDLVYSNILKLEYDDIKRGDGGLVIVKGAKQGVYDIEKESILLEPCIPIEFSIIPCTLSDGTIAYKNVSRNNCEFGYFDTFGNLLFKIKLEDDTVIKLGAFKNGEALIVGNKYYYIFNKEGKYKKEIIKRNLTGNIFHNCEAERWDAMTDGMYGDYPGPGVDYDLLC